MINMQLSKDKLAFEIPNANKKSKLTTISITVTIEILN